MKYDTLRNINIDIHILKGDIYLFHPLDNVYKIKGFPLYVINILQ